MNESTVTSDEIVEREDALRRWFVRDCDPIRAEIDGLDIGWGGVQRWITSVLPLEACRRHLDFACGYATFVAQLAWRFPRLRIVGLNIGFEGPHALADELVAQAGAADRCEFVRDDARRMPFPDGSFDSASCFLGLQDIEIGFGEAGVREALEEATRVLKPAGILAVADEFSVERLRDLLDPLPLDVLRVDARELDVRWNREIAELAIELYADGWEAQVRSDDPARKGNARAAALARMREELERQLADRGVYVPFGPIRLAIARRTTV
jgi:SAM-dependent methyltransferase